VDTRVTNYGGLKDEIGADSDDADGILQYQRREASQTVGHWSVKMQSTGALSVSDAVDTAENAVEENCKFVGRLYTSRI
jgi:hypothetical protein